MGPASFEAIPEGGAAAFVALIEGRVEPVLVTRVNGAPHAFLNRCPHARWPLERFDGRFLFSPDGSLVCAAHGAVFDPETGACRGGPGRGEGLVPVDLSAVRAAL